MVGLPLVAFSVINNVGLVASKCIENDTIDTFFASLLNSSSIPLPDSCCQYDVCGIPCASDISSPSIYFGIAVVVAIFFFCAIGIICYFCIDGKSVNFFVAGRNLPLFVVTLTLASQSIDSNALLGNVDFSYKYHYFDGFCLPVGLGLSLILNAILLARHMNKANVLTLCDIYGKYYGRVVEIIVCIISCCSFTALLAGNLVGLSVILGTLLNLPQTLVIFLSGFIIVLYTITGGLFSVAYSDVFQAFLSIFGVLTITIYMLSTERYLAPPESIGFDGYIYPDSFGDNGVCDMYNGTQCEDFNSINSTNSSSGDLCCYNSEFGNNNDIVADNGAYPYGDKQIFSNQMFNAYSLTPFPNAIIFNWATVFVLGFGNLGALDFQVRSMSARNSRDATIANLIAGCLTFLVGIPFSFLGSITRVYYGPDSQYAQFETDTCSKILDLPQCGLWKPDSNAFVHLLTHNVPPFLGAWCLIAIVAASMSTSDGAILAISTTITRNIMRIKDGNEKIDLNNNNNSDDKTGAGDTGDTGGTGTTVATGVTGHGVTGLFSRLYKTLGNNLVITSRVMMMPFILIACLIASYFKSNHSVGATGYLLIVAFDIMLAGCIVPLIGAFYVKNLSPTCGLISVISGSLTRLILEYTLPKDGFLLFPFNGDEYLDYGSVSTTLYPGFINVNPNLQWDPNTCKQNRFEDYTGIDSLVSPMVSLFSFIILHVVNRYVGCFDILDSHKWMVPIEFDNDNDNDDVNNNQTAKPAEIAMSHII